MKRLSLPHIFQNHMILQRQKPIIIQGTATESMQLCVTLNNHSESYPIAEGHFEITFPSQEAGRGKTLSLYCNEDTAPELMFQDVSIGDIWLAAGQSNMEYFMRYDAHWNETRLLPVNPDIHMYNCPRIAFDGQQRQLPYSGYWFQQDDAAWSEFSAPGYYFAKFIQPDLDIPIGIIGCNWGGTPACAWMGESYLQREPLTIFQKEYEEAMHLYDADTLKALSLESWAFEDSYRHQLEWRAMMYGLTEAEQNLWQQEHQDDPVLPMGPYHHYRPSGLYHTMLQTIAPFSMKGVLWYQGESDSGHADIYDQTLTAMIQCFRDTFKDDALPFLLVQLAPFGKWLDCVNDGYARIRLKQDAVAHNVDHVYMTSIMDLGMWEDIHPKEKREVGKRLALLAKGNVYGVPVLCNPPALSHVEQKGNALYLHFQHVGEQFHGTGNLAGNFKILLHGQSCEITNVTLSGHIICLQYIPAVHNLPNTLSGCSTDGMIISYANSDYCMGNIWNDAQLPLKPFVYSALDNHT